MYPMTEMKLGKEKYLELNILLTHSPTPNSEAVFAVSVHTVLSSFTSVQDSRYLLEHRSYHSPEENVNLHGSVNTKAKAPLPGPTQQCPAL